jgi:iron complex outermembrane recepter protein
MIKKFLCAIAIIFCNTINAQTADTTAIKELLPVSVQATRANDNAPFTKTTLSKKDIAQKNIGVDLPILLNNIANVVSNSDAGAGVGYTGLRMRGNDITRINVTLNGVPVNDAEGQGVFFVNFADLASSAQSIQVQRGVGGSTNGPAAFAGSININSIDLQNKLGVNFTTDYASFNTLRNTMKFYTGNIKNKFNASLRMSRIVSNGYIDRARSNLTSAQFTAKYNINAKQNITFNYMTGFERTYQSWNGVSSLLIDSVRTYNALGLKGDGSFYDQQTDNYGQDYVQLMYNNKINAHWTFSAAPYLTLGKGYYQEWKDATDPYAKPLSYYGISDIINGTDTIKYQNLIRQLWLNNNLLGININALYAGKKINIALGSNASTYNGKHDGSVIELAGQAGYAPWYNHTAQKNEVSVFAKADYKIGKNILLYGDAQVRNVVYNINGFRDNPNIVLNNNWTFVNPKLGANISFGKQKYHQQAYASIGRAAKEPNRDDLEAASLQQPVAEQLINTELGYKLNTENIAVSTNLFYMDYRNQLIPTGKINSVGANTRINTPQSYRAGLEIEAAAKVLPHLTSGGNFSISQNKIMTFTQYIDDYDNGTQISKTYNNTDIAFSPNQVAAAFIDWQINRTLRIKNDANILVNYKYVSKQYLDNTQNDMLALKPWHQVDLSGNYNLNVRKQKLLLRAGITNIFNRLYEANGYTFSYVYGGATTSEVYLFPQAGRRFNIGFVLNIE